MQLPAFGRLTTARTRWLPTLNRTPKSQPQRGRFEMLRSQVAVPGFGHHQPSQRTYERLLQIVSSRSLLRSMSTCCLQGQNIKLRRS